ncbi:DNA primase [Halobellus sp. Atlit-31R]|nr:DNA primase [Halobellus sp. Atlit-31R]
MEDTEKYLIHAAITADGVVERSDVVGAIFGQTEGLLGDDLDLRDLQQSSKVGRIDVEIDSENGQSFGTVTIASSLDRVKTAILAASLETITRVGPCRATVEVTDIEDVREAKRREVVERAKELLSDSFDESVMSSTEILDEVKESVRIEDISEYEGLPAGPHVADSDAVIVVEGRADVLTLLGYGIKNAIAVEGTNVPDAVAELTRRRTTTAFFDGDRGGRLILRELLQVGDVDHVAFAPEGRSVEDLKRGEVFAALRDKAPIESFELEGALEESAAGDAGADTDAAASSDGERPDPRQGSPTTESAAPASGSADAERTTDVAADGAASADADRSGASLENDRPRRCTPTGPIGEPDDDATTTAPEATADASASATTESDAIEELEPEPEAEGDEPAEGPTDSAEPRVAESESKDATGAETGDATEPETGDAAESETGDAAESETGDAAESETGDAAESESEESARPKSLRDHVREVIDEQRGTIRLLDADLVTVSEHSADEAFDAIADADPVPYAAIVDGEFTQRLLDVAAQRGVDHAVAASTGEFVKKPVGVRLLEADQLANSVAS